MRLSFIVNGRNTVLETEPNRRLLDILREDLHLTGTKEGCGEGECGACTVIIGGSLLPGAGLPAGGEKRSHHRGPGGKRGVIRHPAHFHGGDRHPVRVLHGRHDYVRKGPADAQPPSHGGGDTKCPCGKYLPLLRLHPDYQGREADGCGRRMLICAHCCQRPGRRYRGI